MHSVAIRYDTVYLTCNNKLTDSQISLPHEMNKNVKEKKTKNKLMSMMRGTRGKHHKQHKTTIQAMQELPTSWVG